MSVIHRVGSGNRWWLPALLLSAFVLLNAGGWWYYRTTEARLIETVGGRLQTETARVSRYLDGWVLDAWAGRIIDQEAFLLADRLFEEARRGGDFADLHVYRSDGEPWLSGHDDSTAEEATVPRAAGQAFDSAVLGYPAVSPLYRSRSEYFLAACAPIFDFDSSVVAVLVGEAGTEYFSSLRQLRTGLMLLDSFAGLLLLTIGLIWAAVQRRLARAEAAALRSAQLAAMGQLVATVAHELKNPLSIIKNTAERLRKKYGSDDDPLFEFIPEEVDRLDALLRRYLQFARLETGEAEAVLLSTFLNKLGAQLDIPEGAAERLVLRVSNDIAVQADPAALRQVMLNLLLNAVDACRQNDGGEVSVTADRRGQFVEVLIADTGVGMDPETLRRASEPFFSTKTDGSGLGIYLAQTLTEQMNGRMAIRSRAGAGTTVTLVLPAATVE